VAISPSSLSEFIIMSQDLVKALVSEFARLDATKLSRNQAFGIVVNAKNSKGVSLLDHLGQVEAVKTAGAVLNQLGFGQSNVTSKDYW
jgi:hypothetical protein